MIGLPTKVAFRISSLSTPASAATSLNSASSAARTATVISWSPPGFIMT